MNFVLLIVFGDLGSVLILYVIRGFLALQTPVNPTFWGRHLYSLLQNFLYGIFVWLLD